MSAQLKFNQTFALAFTLFFSLLCMPVYAQNPAQTGNNQIFQFIGNILKTVFTFIVNNFQTIADIFIKYILPNLVVIVKAMFSAFAFSIN
ncbi:hypothetical protein CONCODRAFT_7713 [Conidiobolus coronatus NRRL 28638]|uniref:Uncharacterized protein n=1 Tax=Conidiobolus coronatus (strain ATCC 28846 / CBS 209.66 / NRRL 28638) TaxID=796925 RepID=A0A137P481_CONC2|nr:hypothetical protein CONCODRAFT_7713 [Conidiobolus coronatus NRRL 28638]|eukprot:KXN69822.1 hypothetical protein CONCODRAFT_7713 [Conidiobolus coronatus NRRL 28638]